MTSSACSAEAVVALGGDRDDVRAARADLLDVGDHLVEDRRVGRDADDRRGLVEQRDRAVLHLAARVGVGRDVGDLLELQRALERDRQPDVAAEVEEELRVRVALGDRLDARRRASSMSSLDACGQVLDLADELARRCAPSSVPRSSARRSASRYIAATWQTNVFVAATPTSRPARVYSTPSASRVACEPTTFVQASTFAPRSCASRIAASVSAVSPDCVMPMTSSPVADDRVAVALLRGDVHLDRDARPLLDRVAPDQPGV